MINGITLLNIQLARIEILKSEITRTNRNITTNQNKLNRLVKIQNQIQNNESVNYKDLEFFKKNNNDKKINRLHLKLKDNTNDKILIKNRLNNELKTYNDIESLNCCIIGGF